MKLCRECKDAETNENASVHVTGVRTLDNGKKIPYKGYVCDSHLEYIQENDTEIKSINPIA